MFNAQIVAQVCSQIGDSGKRKMTQWVLSKGEFSICIGGQGGGNSGGTAYLNGKKIVLHTLPTGVLYPEVVSLLTRGKVVDLLALTQGRVFDGKQHKSELGELEEHGINVANRLFISKDAQVITSLDIWLDQTNRSQKKGGIGSTGRGIGPAYGARKLRVGLKMGDLFGGREHIKERLAKQVVKMGDDGCPVILDDVVEEVISAFRILKEKGVHIIDTGKLIIEELKKGKKIFCEFVQGTALDVEYGVWPFVTSSLCTFPGLHSQFEIPAGFTDIYKYLIAKVTMSKVGGGPFPSERGGRVSDLYCQDPENSKDSEIEKYGNQLALMLNSKDPFEKGVALRILNKEYGATTGRPRRMGAFDLVLLRYAQKVNDCKNLVLTWTDIPAGMDQIDLCDEYKYNGPERETAYGRLVPGQTYKDYIPEGWILKDMEGVTHSVLGYGEVRGVASWEDLKNNENLKNFLREVQEKTGANIIGLSTGPQVSDYVDLQAY
jgi:adenylosuccinate synthase